MNKPFLSSELTESLIASGAATGGSQVELPEQSSTQPDWQANWKTRLSLYRVVVGLLLASLLWKSLSFPMLFLNYLDLPLRDSFFPAVFQNPFVLVGAVLLPALLGIAVLFSDNRKLHLAQAGITLPAMFVLCVHQGSYNDATFVTCFWVAAWCLWFVSRWDDPFDELLPVAQRFGILIISMVFLGGAVGKLTPGYWSGEVLYQIYFLERDYWIFNLLRANCELESLRSIAMYYSRMVVMTELSASLLWLLPIRIASALAIMVMLGVVVFSNVYLFSVMFCLIGLAIVGLHDA